MSIMGILEAACCVCIVAAMGFAYFAVTLNRNVRDYRISQASARQAAHSHARNLELINDSLRAEYTAVLERCGAGVLILDGNGVIIRANSLAAQWLELPVLSLVRKSLLEASLSNDLVSLFQAVRKVGRQQREVRLTGHVTESVAVVTIAPIEDLAAGDERYILIAQDVTHLRHLETVRRDFVANVSHELRTPLTSIRAIAETLQNGALEDRPTVDRFLKMIVTESERLTRISNDLLVLTVAESRVPARMPVELSTLVFRVLQGLQGQADQAHLVIKSDMPPGLGVLANQDQLEQVIVNLVENAIKYTPSGGCIQIMGNRSEDRITVRVADTGIGIMQQDLPRIFERFYRVDQARSRESGGTGLGLSIVKHMVEAHGGQVSVESEFNHGSTFTVTLPAYQSAEPVV